MTGDVDNPGVCEQERCREAAMTPEQRCRESFDLARRAMVARGQFAPTYDLYRELWFAVHGIEVGA